MHLFGGAVVALGYFTLRDLGLFPNTWLRLVPIVLLVCAVAVAWEVFEAVFGIAKEANYLSDTLIDLILGLFGAVIGFFIGNSVRSLR